IALEQSSATVKLGASIMREMDEVLSVIPGVTRYERAARVTASGGRARNHSPTTRWYFGGDSSAPYLGWLGNDIHRVPRSIIRHGSREQLSALFRGMLEGDGTANQGRWVTFYPGQSSGLADDFQEVALRLGVSTVKHFERSINQWQIRIASKRSMHWIKRATAQHYDG